MSIYYQGACHTCRQWVWLSNVDMDWAEKCMTHWIANFGHEGHDTAYGSEYDEVLQYRIEGKTPVKYLGFGSCETVPNGLPYRLMNEEDDFSYDMSKSATQTTP